MALQSNYWEGSKDKFLCTASGGPTTLTQRLYLQMPYAQSRKLRLQCASEVMPRCTQTKNFFRLTCESGRQMYSYSPDFASKVPCCTYLHFKVKRGPISCSLHFSPSSL